MKRDRDDKKKTRFVRYKEGAALYSMCQTKFERLAKEEMKWGNVGSELFVIVLLFDINYN